MEIIGPQPPSFSSDILDDLWTSVKWKSRGRQAWETYLSYIDFCYTAVSDGMPVCMGSAIRDDSSCYVIGVCVRPDYHRKGIGTAIMTRVIDTARSREYRTIRLHVPEKNKSVKEFYKTFGFQDIKNLGMELFL